MVTYQQEKHKPSICQFWMELLAGHGNQQCHLGYNLLCFPLLIYIIQKKERKKDNENIQELVEIYQRKQLIENEMILVENVVVVYIVVVIYIVLKLVYRKLDYKVTRGCM